MVRKAAKTMLSMFSQRKRCSRFLFVRSSKVFSKTSLPLSFFFLSYLKEEWKEKFEFEMCCLRATWRLTVGSRGRPSFKESLIRDSLRPTHTCYITERHETRILKHFIISSHPIKAFLKIMALPSGWGWKFHDICSVGIKLENGLCCNFLTFTIVTWEL